MDYDALYSLKWEGTATYIRFSSTVEECTGCQYDMSTEDDTFLKAYNKSHPGNPISEDVFEQIMSVFEDTAAENTPHAAVTKTILAFEPAMRNALKLAMMEDKLLAVAQDFYEFWSGRRQANNYDSLQPKLKFETSPDSDDGDPYVCFRRREVRPTRKTRARDLQFQDKLRTLRKELEDARQIMALCEMREKARKAMIDVDLEILNARMDLKAVRRKHNIVADDDDLLINQKVDRFNPTTSHNTDKQ